MADSAAVAALKRSRDNVATVIEAKTLEWTTAGCPPTFSIDGESYSWNEWLKTKVEELKGLTEAIQQLSSPWILRSTGRA